VAEVTFVDVNGDSSPYLGACDTGEGASSKPVGVVSFCDSSFLDQFSAYEKKPRAVSPPVCKKKAKVGVAS